MSQAMNNNKREKKHEFLSIFSSQIFNQHKDNRIKIYFQNFCVFINRSASRHLVVHFQDEVKSMYIYV